MPLLALLEDTVTAHCLHVRRAASHTHRLCAEGRCCQHDIVCEACGAVVGVASWRLDIWALAHAQAYPVDHAASERQT